MSMADVDAEEAVVTFDGIAILTPRYVKHPIHFFSSDVMMFSCFVCLMFATLPFITKMSC